MELTQIVEALVFAAPEPLTAKEIARTVRRATEESPVPALQALQKTTAGEVQAAIDELSETYNATGRSLQFVETANGWRLFSRPEFAPYVRALLPDARPERLSPPALETLAIIAYRQPITKANIEAVRGVSVDGVLQKVIDRGLVKIGGRADLPGRPLLYETSDTFLDHFGIKNLDDLPNAGELRQIALPDAEASASEEQLTLAETGDGETGDTVVENSETDASEADDNDTDASEAEVEDTEVEDTEVEENGVKNTEVKNTEAENTEVEDTEVEDTEVEDAEPQTAAAEETKE